MTVPRIVLASGSPRRAAVLEQLGLDFAVEPAEIDETLAPGEPPDAAALRLAREKASTAAREGWLSLGFDTLVALDDDILAKPVGPSEAVEMLLRLSGRSHVVHTGIALADGARLESAVGSTRVWIRELDRPACESYVGTGEPLDKAGAYGIQGFGASIVERIEGDYFTVMGFPLPIFIELLGRFGLRYAFGRLTRES